MSITRNLIDELSQPGKCPGAQDLKDLAYAIHAAQVACDAPEMIWMSINFEDMGDVMHAAMQCELCEEVAA